MAGGDPVLEYLAHRIAMVLEQHYTLSNGLSDYLDPSRIVRPQRERLAETLESLRALRGRLLEDFREAGARMAGAGVETLKDLYALAAFFVEVSYEAERRALGLASSYLDVASDVAELEELRRAVEALVSSLGEAIRRADPSWPVRVGRQPL